MDKQKEASRLEEEAKQLRREAHEEKQKKERAEKENFEKEAGINVYAASDYCGMGTREYRFYFGYEYTVCPKHEAENCSNKYDCQESEWAFVVWKGDRELMRLAQSKIHPERGEEMLFYLTAGIGHFLQSRTKSN